MYKLSDLSYSSSKNTDNTVPFIYLLKSKWDELHSKSDVFRYKINSLQEKIVDDKYLLQLNPDRGSKRRFPENIDNICQEFDDNKFNFTKVLSKEVLFSLKNENDDQDSHLVIVNVSPISKYHSLLCPSVNKKLPQVVTRESFQLVVDILQAAADRDLVIGFNSLCAFASVNHLHYHLFIEKRTLSIEKVEWTHVKGPLHCIIKDHPVPAFCFEVEQHSSKPMTKEIYKLIEYFLQKSIAHNILVTSKSWGKHENSVKVIIYPRKGTMGVKQLDAFNVAVCELSGWFPVYNEEAFPSLTKEDLERELKKWKLDNFNELCDNVKQLY